MKKILITGANGYIGSRLGLMFAEAGFEVSCHVYPTIPEDNNWVKKFKKIIVGDLRNSGTIDKITDDCYDAVIHLVSLDHFMSQSLPIETVNSINILPTWLLLNSFALKSNLKKFIYFSTVQVYGNDLNGLISESRKPFPTNIYGLTHLLSEEIINYYEKSSNIQCTNLRLSNSFGSPVFKDVNCWWLVINDLCRQAFFDQKIVLKSDGSPRRDFIHYSDIYSSLKTLIENQQQYKTINLASGVTYTILELAQIIKQLYSDRYKKEILLKYKSSNSKKSRGKFNYNTKALQLSGIKVINDLSFGINELFDYFEKNEQFV